MNWAVVLLVAVAGVALAMPSSKQDPDALKAKNEVESEEICVSRSCIAVSNDFLKNINESVNPCDDFYEFACGRFLTETRIPDDKTSVGTFSDLAEKVHEQSRTLLEQKPQPDDFECYESARKYYRSCMDVKHLDEVGLQPLLDQLKDLGGWPVLLEQDKWDQSGFDTYQYLLSLESKGLNSDLLFNAYIDADSKNTSWRVLHVDDADLGLTRENLVKGFNYTNVQVYYKFMVDSAMLLGAADRDSVMLQMKEALQFEIRLAELNLPQEEKRNATKLYNPTTSGQLPQLKGFPSSWKDFFNHKLKSADIQVDDQEKVVLTHPGFLESVSELLSGTSPRVVSNYLGWRVVKEMISFLNSDARKVRQEFDKGLNGKKEPDSDWKRCAKQIGSGSFETSNFVFALGSMYAKQYFKKEVKAKVEDMASYLKKAFREDILETIDWMDEKTKLTAKSKLDKMEAYMGYRDELLNQTIMDQIHQGLEVSETDYFGNTMRLKKFWRAFFNKRLREKVDKSSFVDHRFVALVNALYFGDQNVFEFTAGILQGAFYNADVPNYVNFGAVGSVIGHEITHGFDDQGKQRDENGEIRNWWQPDTETRFREKAKCIIDQYSKYRVEPIGLNLNGINTQGENIADNGGTKEAYFAYKRWVADHGPEPGLPGLPYSPSQLFWIANARSWCRKTTDESAIQMVLSDPHSHAKFRIIGTVSNNENFAKDFECPPGSPMNPQDKCIIW